MPTKLCSCRADSPSAAFTWIRESSGQFALAEELVADAVLPNDWTARLEAQRRHLAVVGTFEFSRILLRRDLRIISVTRSKQRQAQQYPLSRVVGGAVLRYLKEVRPRVKDRNLFLTLLAPYRGLRPAGLWPSVGPRVRALGIRVQHPGPHCLRHACAARLLSQGLSFKQIADHLGHSSLEATWMHLYQVCAQ